MPNETHSQICAQFWQFDQDEVLRPYVRALPRRGRRPSPTAADGWAERSSAIRQHVLGLLFPRPLADRGTLQLMTLWLGGTKLSDSVPRQVNERRDDAERSLRCQEAAARAELPRLFALGLRAPAGAEDQRGEHDA